MSAELESFFSGLSSSLDLAARFEAQAARFAAPSFSIFKYIPTSEDGVTRILRDLLDPQGDRAASRGLISRRDSSRQANS